MLTRSVCARFHFDEALKKAVEATPEDYEVLWRAARIRNWQADGTTDAKVKKSLGKQVGELGDRARKVAPDRVETQLADGEEKKAHEAILKVTQGSGGMIRPRPSA